MQTFLPYADFAKCAQVLDGKRLNKQILEVYQILRAIKGRSKGWRNHPATKMWTGYAGSLACYGWKMCQEFLKRRGKSHAYANKFLTEIWGVIETPPFHTKKRFLMYRSLLLRKNPTHYRKFWPKLSDKIPFVWPDGTVSKS